jgi:putative ABC transport system permease protein
MSLFVKVHSFLRNIFSPGHVDSDLDQEVHSHLDLLADENLRAGMTPEEAQRAARIELGGIEQVKEQVREQRLGNWFSSVFSDCRFALRMLRKSPAFTFIAILTLTLGIGANTAIFSFADMLLNHPVALRHMDRLVSVNERKATGEEMLLAPANFRDLRAETTSFESLAAYQDWTTNAIAINGVEELRGARVSEDFFATLAIRPVLGREFLPDEFTPGKDRVLILSYAFWKREFAGDPSAIKHSLKLGDEIYSVIGVMPASFQFPTGGQFWAPLSLTDSQFNNRAQGTLDTVGLLKPTSSAQQARAELAAIWSSLQQRYFETNREWQLSVLPLRERLVDEDSRQFATLFLCVSGFVVLIVCVNVANLQLARAASRERELTVRAAVGAGRMRIARQLVTESLLLSAIGGAGGLLLAFWGVALMRAAMPAQVREITDVSGMKVDLRAFLFTLFVAVISGLLSGVLPAVLSSRVNLRAAMESGGSRISGAGHRLRKAFVISEVALAVVLLVGAGLMVKGFYLLADHEGMIQPQSLLTFHLNLSTIRYGLPDRQRTFYSQTLERLRAIRGVEAVAAVSGLPYSFYEDDAKALPDNWRTAGAAGDLPTIMRESISDDYFHVLRLPLVAGRSFNSRDTLGSPLVACISQSMAHRLWPGTTAIGHRLRLPESNAPDQWITIVGVVADTRHEVYDRSFRSILYQPMAQIPLSSMDFALRTSGDPHLMANQVRSAVAEMDPSQPITRCMTMAEKMKEQASALQFVAVLMGLFGLLAIILSSAGIYGLISCFVVERRREIGIRMALGARPVQVLTLVVILSFSLVAVGGALGLATGFVLAEVLSSMLYGVRAWDPMVYSAVPLLLVFVTALATLLPAMRAARVDPMIALRYE